MNLEKHCVEGSFYSKRVKSQMETMAALESDGGSEGMERGVAEFSRKVSMFHISQRFEL